MVNPRFTSKLRPVFSPLLCLIFVLAPAAALRAEYLFQNYLLPSFYGNANTEFSEWDAFTSAYNGQNKPDINAPFEPVGQPGPYTDARNPYIIQTIDGSALLTTGTANIYGINGPMQFVVTDSTADAATAYNVGTVVFQFQLEGQVVDLADVRLVYNQGGTEHSVLASALNGVEYIREYRPGGTQGGYTERVSIQWDLRGLGAINSYQIVMDTASHASLQEDAAGYGRHLCHGGGCRQNLDDEWSKFLGHNRQLARGRRACHERKCQLRQYGGVDGYAGHQPDGWRS